MADDRGACGEAPWGRILHRLGNPRLSPVARDALEATIAGDVPVFNRRMESDHFSLQWTDNASHSDHNIGDCSIIKEAVQHLEEAWRRFEGTFGKPPHVPNGGSKLDVVFYDLPGGYNGVASPTGPLALDSDSWVHKPWIRAPLCAHELFHYVQYAFGFKVHWRPPEPYEWFSEGTAAWSEVFTFQRVIERGRLEYLFAAPNVGLFAAQRSFAEYAALPFWIFFEVGLGAAPAQNPLRRLLQTCQETGDPTRSLARVIADAPPTDRVAGAIADFFALFSRARLSDAWRTGLTGSPYPAIAAGGQEAITPRILLINRPVGPSGLAPISNQVEQLGADYYRLAFAPEIDGKRLDLTVAGAPGGDYTIDVVSERGGRPLDGTFLPGAPGPWTYATTIDRAQADALVLVISGRDTGGTYDVRVSVS